MFPRPRKSRTEKLAAQHEQDTLWNTAIRTGRIAAVRELLEHDADINRKNLDGSGTPLHLALINHQAEIARYLITHGADINLVNSDFHSPIEIAALQNDARLLSELIAHRQCFTVSLFERIVTNACRRYLRSHQNPAILGHYVSRLTASNISRIAREEHSRLKYLAHLESLKGRTGDGGDLEGWCGDKFLALRIYVYFTTLIKLMIGDVTDRELGSLPPADLIEEKRGLRTKLQQEILLNIETLRTLHDIHAIQRITNPLNQRRVRTACAQRIAQTIRILPQYSFYCASANHVMYLNFTKINPELIQIRIDNLGAESDRHSRGRNINWVKPYVHNVNAAVFAAGENGESYIESLLATFEDDSRFTLSKAYAMERLNAQEVMWNGDDFKLQEVGNCVVHNHQMGVAIRWGKEISAWLVNQELLCIAERRWSRTLQLSQDPHLWDQVSDEETMVDLVHYREKFALGRMIAREQPQYEELKRLLEECAPFTWEIASATTNLPQPTLRATMFIEQKKFFEHLHRLNIIKFKYTSTGIPNEFELAIYEWNIEQLHKYLAEHARELAHQPHLRL